MYLGSFAIDDTCTFTCNTHTPATGAAVDADAVPSYRVYEDETATPILTGNMALLDDSNTTGYYSEQITLSAANGLEYGKSYTIRIAAVVGGVTGVCERHFSMGAKVNTTHVGGTVQTAGDLSAQIGNIGMAGSPSYAAPSSFTLSTGVQASGTYANVDSPNGVYHVLNDSGGVLSAIYDFTLRSDEQASSIGLKARVNGSNDSILFNVWDWVSGAWVLFYTLAGTNGATDTTPTNLNLVAKYTGTGANAGRVRIQVANNGTLTSAALNIDVLIVGKSVTGRSTGYQDGYVYIDSVAGTAGSVAWVNGMVDKPCTTLAEAYAICTAVGLKKIDVAPNTTITLTQSAAGWGFRGGGRINLNGQNIADAVFDRIYTISGVGVGGDMFIYDCGVGSVTLEHCYMWDCQYKGTFTAVAGNDYVVVRGVDAVAGTGSQPIFVLAANVNFGVRGWDGGAQFNGMVASTNLVLSGQFRCVLDASCVGGSVVLRGFAGVPSGSTAFLAAGGTISDDARFATDQLTSGGLTAQETRDAMKLAPTSGTPAVGSVDAHLDTIIADDPWDATDHPVRTLSVSAGGSVAASRGTTLRWYQGDTISESLTDLGSMTGATSVTFTLKETYTDSAGVAIPDDEALVKVDETGLLVINGTVATITDGDLVIDDAASGDITIKIDADAWALVASRTSPGYVWDIRMLHTGAVTTLAAGRMIVMPAVGQEIIPPVVPPP